MSKSRAFQLGAAALAVAGVLSACSGGNSGGVGSIPPPASRSSADTSSSSASASGGSGGEAPSVPSPLPTSELTADPCSGLAPEQVTQIGLAGPGSGKQDQTGPECTWKSSTSQFNNVTIAPMTINKNGLSDIYANKSKDAYFEPTTVAGYPAVYAGISEDRAKGYCNLWVGTTDNLAVGILTIIGSGPNKSNPCPVAERVATAMIQHLQGS
jgi:hypothetical protein